MILLDVPYRSQEAQDAKKYGNDCGLACVAMIKQYRTGINMSIDQLAAIRPPAPFSKTTDLVAVGRKIGLRMETTDGSIGRVLSIGRIKAEIQLGNPCILLVCYERIPDRLNRKYRGGHYILAVGFDDEQIIVHDPDWWGPLENEGAFRRYHESVITDAMRGCPGYFSISQQGVFDWT